MALVVAELEHRRLDREAVDPLDEASPIGAATEFAVGHDLEADILLHLHDIADALILDLRKCSIVDALAHVIAEGLPQHRRTQQAADMVGAERWSALRQIGHWRMLPE